MIICVKESKLKKVDKNLFRIASISSEPLESEGIFNMTELLPPADLLMKVSNGELSKKKFLKKYRKFIETKDTNIEYTIFTLGMALERKQNLCLTASGKEYRLGYVKVLADYLAELYGIEIKGLDEVQEEISFELDSFSKKEKKILKKSDEDLSKKQRKFKEKMLKTVSKSIRDGFGDDGKDNYSKMDKKFAIDQIAMVLIKAEAVKIDKKNRSFKDIDADKIKTTKPYIKSIFIACDASKAVKKTVKPVFESHGIKFKEKSLKKLDTTTFISLFGEIYGRVLSLRSGVED